jgi:dihydroorotase
MTHLLLRAVRILDPVSQMDCQSDVWLSDGQIQAIAPRLEVPDHAVVCDRPGLVVGPGLVDLYSQSGEPGYETRETLKSLADSAIAGGFSRLTLLPNTSPPVDTAATAEWIRSHWHDDDRLQVNLWGALTRQLNGQELSDIADLQPLVAGFSDGQPIGNLGLVQRALTYLSPSQRPIGLWCCDRTLTYGGTVRDGVDATRLGLPGNPAYSESAAIAAVLECVAAQATPVHLMRISTARSVDLIRQAKTQRLPITASTTWMHLLLSTADLDRYNPNLRLEPPLGTPEDQAALQQAVKDGVIDAIAIDHTPHTYEDKTVPFSLAPPGAIGLQLALPILWQRFVASGEWSALTLWSALSTNPAIALAQEPPRLAAGYPAEVTILDPTTPWSVTTETLKSRSCNTPWLGQSVLGRVLPLDATGLGIG